MGIYVLFRALALSLITLIEFLMLARAIMSWFPQVQGGKLYQIIYMVTEPVIAPFRALLNKIPALRGFPLDLSFFLTYIVLIMLEYAL